MQVKITPTTAAAIGGSIGLVVWFALLHWRKSPALFGRLVVGVICIGLLFRVAFALFTPTFFAPDEQSHFNYVKYLYTYHAFPVQHSQTDAPSNDWEYYQPPLYYILCLPVYWIANHVSAEDRDVLVCSLRSMSIVLWIANIYFARKLLDRLQMTDMYVRGFILCVVALLPTYAVLSSSINNDNLLITLGGLLLYILAQNITTGRSVWLGVLLGVALLTKLTAVVYVFAIAAVLVAQYAAGRLSLVVTTSRFLTTTSIAAIMWLPWGLRNVSVYNDLTAESVANVPHRWRSTSDAITTVLKTIAKSFSSVSGIYNNIEFFPIVGFVLLGVACLGIVYALLRRPTFFDDQPSAHANIFFMSAMALTVIVNYVLVLRFGLLYNQGQGRFLYPMIIPIALLMAIGIKHALNTTQAHVHAAGCLVSYFLAFAGFNLALFATTGPATLIQQRITVP